MRRRRRRWKMSYLYCCCCWFRFFRSNGKSAYGDFLQSTELLKRSQMQFMPFVCVDFICSAMFCSHWTLHSNYLSNARKFWTTLCTPTSCRFWTIFLRLNFNVEKKKIIISIQFVFNFPCLLKCSVSNKQYVGSQNIFFYSNWGHTFQ